MSDQTKRQIEEIGQAFDRQYGPWPQSVIAHALYSAFRQLSIELRYIVLEEDFDFNEFDALEINQLHMSDVIKGYSLICDKLRESQDSG